MAILKQLLSNVIKLIKVRWEHLTSLKFVICHAECNEASFCKCVFHLREILHYVQNDSVKN